MRTDRDEKGRAPGWDETRAEMVNVAGEIGARWTNRLLNTYITLLLACEKYSKEHAIIYNSKKSSVLICKNRATLHVTSPSFAVNDIAIGEVAKVKYLGHVITNDMPDDADMMRQRRHLYRQCLIKAISYVLH